MKDSFLRRRSWAEDWGSTPSRFSGQSPFYTWMWGPLGAFLAVPLLMALSVSLAHAFGEDKPDLPH